MYTPGVVSQKDTTLTKLFVGGLPYHTTDKSLNEFFSKFGNIDEAVVITDRQTGDSKGYGFVTMSDREGAERACEDPNPIIDGRKANVNLAYLGAKPRGIQTVVPQILKTGLPVSPVQYGYPQVVYPSTYLASPGGLSTSVQQPATSSVGQQYVDYSSIRQQPLDYSAIRQHYLDYSLACQQYPNYSAAYLSAAAAASGQLNNSLEVCPLGTPNSVRYVTPTYALPQHLNTGTTAVGHINTGYYAPQQLKKDGDEELTIVPDELKQFHKLEERPTMLYISQ